MLRDLALNLFWVNRYALTMYEKVPTRWRDVPRYREDVFLPVFKPWVAAELTATIEAGSRALPATWDAGVEDKMRVGNTSSASIPVAIHDAVSEGRITRPTRIFAPGFGAGAVGGYVVMRVDPAVVA